MHTPLNAEGLFGLAITLLLIIAPKTAESKHSERVYLLAGIAIAVITVAAFVRALPIYFLSDDFIIVKTASAATAADLRGAFTRPGGDGFFRPIGFVSLALESKWAAFSPVLWHISGLALHITNSVLVWIFALRMGASRTAACFAGALFALHGTGPGSVVWIAARFDLVATFFVLAGLLLFVESCRRAGPLRYSLQATALLCMLAALLSKESAYIFPVLLLIYILPKRKEVRQGVGSVAPFFVLAAAVFVYRWTLFHGIGGYVVRETGQPQAFSLGLRTTLKAVGVRLWAALYFPINWSTEPSIGLTLVSITYLAALIAVAVRSRPSKSVWVPLAFVLVAVIPPLHMLAIGADLGNSRVVYLPAVGFCVFLALAIDAVNDSWRVGCAIVFLLFQFMALQHNLSFWIDASAVVRTACAEAADAAGTSNKLLVSGLPADIRGVPAFANGFKHCVAINAGRPVDIESVNDTRNIPQPGTIVLEWDRVARKLAKRSDFQR